jgi:hypothetical protein
MSRPVSHAHKPIRSSSFKASNSAVVGLFNFADSELNDTMVAVFDSSGDKWPELSKFQEERNKVMGDSMSKKKHRKQNKRLRQRPQQHSDDDDDSENIDEVTLALNNLTTCIELVKEREASQRKSHGKSSGWALVDHCAAVGVALRESNLPLALSWSTDHGSQDVGDVLLSALSVFSLDPPCRDGNLKKQKWYDIDFSFFFVWHLIKKCRVCSLSRLSLVFLSIIKIKTNFKDCWCCCCK